MVCDLRYLKQESWQSRCRKENVTYLFLNFHKTPYVFCAHFHKIAGAGIMPGPTILLPKRSK
jgi:hypothetical protein